MLQRTLVALFLALSAAGRPLRPDEGPARLLADLAPGVEPRYLSLYGFAALGERAVFLGSDHELGPAIWTTDGTAAGTQLLDLLCHPCGEVRPLGAAGGVAFFLQLLSSSPARAQLWASDGTLAGTRLIGAPFDLPPYPREFLFAPAAGRLYYTACATGGCTVWASDGSEAGTVPLAAPIETTLPAVVQLVAVGDRVFVLTHPPDLPLDLWLGDGAARVLRRLAATPQARMLTASPDRLWFVAAADGFEVWSSRGTVASTGPVTAFERRNPFTRPTPLLPVGDQVYFFAHDGAHGRELWRAGGRAPATRLSNLRPVEPFDFGLLLETRGRVVFGARQGESTSQGSAMFAFDLKDGARRLQKCPGGCPTVFGTAAKLGDGRFVLFGRDARGSGFWVTDGTATGTRNLAHPDPAYWTFAQMRTLGDRVLIAYTEEYELGQLWLTDGSRAGTFLAARGGPSWSHYFGWRGTLDAAAAGSRSVFASFEPELGTERLWSAGGGPEDSAAILDERQGRSSHAQPVAGLADGLLVETCDSEVTKRLRLVAADRDTLVLEAKLSSCDQRLVSPPVAVGARLVVHAEGAYTSEFPARLFAIDAEHGAQPLTDPAAGWPSVPVAFGGGAAFAVFRGVDRPAELWWSDGTAAGTQARLTLPAGQIVIRDLTAIGGRLLFMASDGLDTRPWTSDGTAAGTLPLAAAVQRLGVARQPFVELGGAVFFLFAPGDATAAIEIWKSDGTPAGTGPAIAGGADFHAPAALQSAAGRLFWLAAGSGDSEERFAFSSDGTQAGTERLCDAPVDALRLLYTGEPAFAELGGGVVFAAVHPALGEELWRSDGTAAGTALLRDLAPGRIGSHPRGFAAWSGRLWFAARNRRHGMELWSTDGSAEGTRLVQDLATGPSWSSPAALLPAGDRLYFSAHDGSHGREPWLLEEADLP